MTASLGVIAASVVAFIGVGLIWFALRYADREHAEAVAWQLASAHLRKMTALGLAFRAASEAGASAFRELADAFRQLGESMRWIDRNEVRHQNRQDASTCRTCADAELPDDWSA